MSDPKFRHLTLSECREVVRICALKLKPEERFKKLKAEDLTNTVEEFPGPWYLTRMSKRCSARVKKEVK